jgi:hypothetical protein
MIRFHRIAAGNYDIELVGDYSHARKIIRSLECEAAVNHAETAVTAEKGRLGIQPNRAVCGVTAVSGGFKAA